MAANRRSYVGRVVSAKMQNTLVVAVDRVRHHAVYGKALRRKTVLYVHDPLGESQYGDLVRVIECRPVSKTKRFRLQAVLQRHEVLRPEEFAEAEAVMAEAVETGQLLAAIVVAEEAAGSEAEVEETVAGMDEATDDSVDEEAEAEAELDGGAPVAEAEAAEVQEAATEEPEASVAEAIEHEAPVAEAPSEEPAADEADEPAGTEEAEAEAPAGEAEAAEEEPQAAEEAESPTAEAPPEEADAIVEEAEAPAAEVLAEEAAPEATDAAEEASSEDGETPRKEDA